MDEAFQSRGYKGDQAWATLPERYDESHAHKIDLFLWTPYIVAFTFTSRTVVVFSCAW